jgi:hypothetical protein
MLPDRENQHVSSKQLNSFIEQVTLQKRQKRLPASSKYEITCEARLLSSRRVDFPFRMRGVTTMVFPDVRL